MNSQSPDSCTAHIKFKRPNDGQGVDAGNPVAIDQIVLGIRRARINLYAESEDIGKRFQLVADFRWRGHYCQQKEG